MPFLPPNQQCHSIIQTSRNSHSVCTCLLLHGKQWMAVNDEWELKAKKCKSEFDVNGSKSVGFLICLKWSDSNNIWIQTPTRPYFKWVCVCGGSFFGTTLVSWRQKRNPFWVRIGPRNASASRHMSTPAFIHYIFASQMLVWRRSNSVRVGRKLLALTRTRQSPWSLLRHVCLCECLSANISPETLVQSLP